MKPKEANHYKTEFHNPFYADPQFLYPVATKFKEMFGWQRDAFDDGKNARFFATQAFCGSGKSILQINLAIHDIVSSGYKQKQLVVVPQEHIHRGFVGEGDLNFLSICQNGQEYEWNIQPEHNFCDGKDRLDGLRDWLLMPSYKLAKGFNGNTIGGLNSICSHAALIGVWKTLTEDDKFQVIRNLTLRIDEAHHINHVFLDSEDLTPEERLAIDYESTELGRLCTYVINSKTKTAKLHLTTATMYRGDRRTILSKEVRGKFVEYNLDWIEHFRSLGIKSFYLQYEEYKNNPIEQIIQRIKAEPKEKHFVVVPPTRNKWRKDGNEYKELLAKINKLGLRVLDLITPETQDRNKKLLLQEPKANNPDTPSKFDVVVVCMLGREGTDWCPCSRLHNASCENSITLAVQTIGRPFRRYEGKEVVKIYHYTKQFSMPKAGLTKRELLSDRTNALLVCMQINDMTNPILVPIIPKQGDEGKQSSGNTTTLESIFGDQYNNVLQSSLEKYECLEDHEKTPKGVFELAGYICDEYGISKHHENRENIQLALTARILREICPELKLAGINVSFIRQNGFDKIASKYELDRSVYFGDYTECDWETIRNIIKSKRTLEEWVVVAEKLAKQYNDILPSQRWLKLNGYEGLSICIRNNPDSFSHIVQDVRKTYRGIMTLEEQVKFAEELAKEHGGILPNTGWLTKQKMFGLLDAMHNYPDAFSHIERPRLRRPTSLEESLLQAEELVAKYGKLPIQSWLKTNGFRRLARMIEKDATPFSHFTRDVNKMPLEESVEIVKRLAKENNGKIPTALWFKQNGYERMVNIINKNKHLFEGIERSFAYENKPKDFSKCWETVNRLLEQNNGKLPPSIWLRDNGYNNLRAMMQNHPDEFGSVPREYKSYLTKDSVALAERLAKDNDGYLPRPTWLIENGHNGVYQSMCNHPEKYAHIPKESSKGKSLEDHKADAEALYKTHEKLPSSSWLLANGYGGLVARIQKDPDEFRKFKQEKIDRRDQMKERSLAKFEQILLRLKSGTEFDSRSKEKRFLYAVCKSKLNSEGYSHDGYIWYPEYDEIAKRLGMQDVFKPPKKTLPVGIYDRNGRYRVYVGDSNLGTYLTLDEAIRVRKNFMENNVSSTRL